jgi:DNA-binding transcriptional LysR family regulator
MRYTLCASPRYLARRGRPKHPEALSEHDALRFPVSGVGASWHFRKGRGRVLSVPVSSKLVAANGVALRQAAVAGMGIALLPSWNVAEAVAEGALVRLLPEWTGTVSDFDVAAWVLYPSRRQVPAKVQAFIDWLKGEFQHGAPSERSLGARRGP